MLYGKVTHSVECCVKSEKLVLCMHICFGSKVNEAGSISYRSTSYRCCPLFNVNTGCDMRYMIHDLLTCVYRPKRFCFFKSRPLIVTLSDDCWAHSLDRS